MFAQSQGKLKKPSSSQDRAQDEYNQDVHKTVTQIMTGLNKNISYGNGTNTDENQNVDGWHSGTIAVPGVANTAFTVNHTLGRIPIGYHLIYTDQPGILYLNAPFTSTQGFFKFSVGSGNIKIFLF